MGVWLPLGVDTWCHIVRSAFWMPHHCPHIFFQNYAALMSTSYPLGRVNTGPTQAIVFPKSAFLKAVCLACRNVFKGYKSPHVTNVGLLFYTVFCPCSSGARTLFFIIVCGFVSFLAWAFLQIELTQNLKWSLKMRTQFWVPIVALSGDACPLWAWQDLRSLGEVDHSKTFKQNFENKENYSNCTR